MDQQLRRPAREAQRIRPGVRVDARGWDARPRGGSDERCAAAQDLAGVMFTTPKELRHIAEQHFGELFVPTEVLEEGPLAMVIALRLDLLGTLVVHAERARRWYPFRITRVEVASPEARAAGRPDATRTRLPYGYRISTRPRIDWL